MVKSRINRLSTYQDFFPAPHHSQRGHGLKTMRGKLFPQLGRGRIHQHRGGNLGGLVKGALRIIYGMGKNFMKSAAGKVIAHQAKTQGKKMVASAANKLINKGTDAAVKALNNHNIKVTKRDLKSIISLPAQAIKVPVKKTPKRSKRATGKRKNTTKKNQRGGSSRFGNNQKRQIRVSKKFDALSKI